MDIAITQKQYQITITILCNALVHISENWTNRGFKIKQEDGSYRTDALGAIDIATRAHPLMQRQMRDDDPAVFLVNEMAKETYQQSIVSVNDELGYKAVITTFSKTIERAVRDAASLGTGIRRIEARAVGSSSGEGKTKPPSSPHPISTSKEREALRVAAENAGQIKKSDYDDG